MSFHKFPSNLINVQRLDALFENAQNKTRRRENLAPRNPQISCTSDESEQERKMTFLLGLLLVILRIILRG